MCGKYREKRFLALEEKMEKLKAYKEWLINESKGVEEDILKLKETSQILAQPFLLCSK